MFETPTVFGGGADEKLVTPAEGKKLASFADSVARWTVYISLLLFPLFYYPGFVDSLELPKQALLVTAAVIAALAWLGKMLVTRKLEFRNSILHLFVGLYVVIYAISAWTSKSRYMSLVGDFGQEHSGLATLACFVVLYIVAVNVMRDAKDVRKALGWMLLGALVVLLQAFLQAIGVKVLPGVSSNSYNLIGTSNALGAYAAMAAAMVMCMFVMPADSSGKMEVARKIAMGLLLALSVVFIATLNYWVLWAMLIVGSLVLVAYGMIKSDRKLKVTMLAIPMAAIVIGALFMFIRFPVSLGLPAEVMPSLSASWNISREALANKPLLGSGPGTFLFDYTQFRSKDLNSTNFWSVPFDRSSSHLLTLLATTGIIGLATYLIMLLYLAVRTKIKLWRGHEEWLTTMTVFIGWAVLLVGRVLYSSNITLDFGFWMLTAMLVTLQWHNWSEAKFDQSPRAALGLTFLFIVAIILSVSGLYLEGQRLVAEAHYTKGATIDVTKQGNADIAVQELLRATQLNGNNDLYFRTLSQALAVSANQQAQAAGAKPTDDQSRAITLLAANAVNAGKHAADLSPSNVENWASLAGMYRDLGQSVPGATDAALASYAKAAELDPSNPIYPTELGKLYLGMSDAAVGSITKDTKADDKTAIQKTATDNLNKASEQFNKSISLKQDYAPAHYWLAMVLVRQGKTADAISKLESVRNYNPNDLGVGFQLAILYWQNDQKDAAIGELQRLIKIEPHYSNARWYLAAMLEDKGDIDGAIAQIQEVKKDNPDNTDVQKRLDDLNAKKNGASSPPVEELPNPPEGQPPVK